MARHRSTREPVPTLSGLTALLKPPWRSRHRPTQRMHRHPLTAMAATVVAAGIFVGSQPVPLSATADASRAFDRTAASAAAASRSADSAASRSERLELDPAIVTPPSLPGAAEAVVPNLSASCPTGGFGGVEPHVAEAGYHLMALFGIPESSIGGVASRPGNPTSDHPRGLALDFMVNTSTGNALAAYAEENSEALGINYILWQVADHYDHVHISFNGRAGTGVTC